MIIMEFTKQMKFQFGLSEESLNTILSDMEEVFYKKGESIVQEGQRNLYIYYVHTGLLCSYMQRDGNNIPFFFTFEGELTLTTTNRTANQLSKLSLEACVDSVLLRIPRKRMEELYYESVEIANWGRKLTEIHLQEYENYFLNYWATDKTCQYETLIKERPELLQAIPLQQLASYLGITPQSLSRIRARRK